MAQPNPQHLRSLYRRILRELPSRPLSAPSQVQQRLRSQFKGTASDAPQTSPETIEQISLYLRSQRLYTTLVERYNPGMNMDEEERTRLTARRVGMEMPPEYAKLLGGDTGRGGGRGDGDGDGQGGRG